MSTKKSSKLKSTHMIDTRDNIVEDLPIYGHNFKGVKSPPFVNIQTLIFASKQKLFLQHFQKMKVVLNIMYLNHQNARKPLALLQF